MSTPARALTAVAWILAACAALPATAAATAAAPRPRVVIDGGHHNLHTVEHRYAPFAALLRHEGFQVTGTTQRFTAAALAGADVLVIANALHASNVASWASPTPSAFTAAEVAAVAAWVRRGGALLLIADHFPFPGAVQPLAAAFGVEWLNGFAFDADPRDADVYTRASGALRDHPITRGDGTSAPVTALATFTGSAFTAPPEASPLIVLPPAFVVLLPTQAWQFDAGTPRRPGAGLLQGAALRHGKGRVAVFAEAGMFTAQSGTGDPPVAIGFNAPVARENAQFVVNTVRWLAGRLPD